MDTPTNPRHTQVGGEHYKAFPIQPAEWSERNHLGFLAGCITKRICRWQRGGKGIEDLDKAAHECELLIAETTRSLSHDPFRRLAPTWTSPRVFGQINGLSFLETDVLVRLMEWRKHGRIIDLRFAQSNCQYIKTLEEHPELPAAERINRCLRPDTHTPTEATTDE